MSRTVDERVVKMQFDNNSFERNVEQSMNTLDRLNSKLSMKEASKGLDEVNESVKKFDATPLTAGLNAVSVKLSALQVAGVTAVANITNSVVNAGKKLVSEFTVAPVKSGLDEYETQLDAVQTILANTQSKGSTLEDVNNALDELNTYADKTIYNFTEMTRNIGTFTAAGVELDKSVAAIKGIANLAAVSGSTSAQASTAMYQLSQALAAGKLTLQDWNSVVNAGMGGQVFQNALKRTAKAIDGVDVDALEKQYGSFRESLTKTGWLTADVLTKTLETFTGDLTKEQLLAEGYTQSQAEEIIKMGNTANEAATKVKTFTQLMDTLKEAAGSGWTQTWQILIGDFEQAKELWTKVSDYFSEILNKSAETRNNILETWKSLGGRDLIIKAITNAWSGLLSVLTPIKKAFSEVFGSINPEYLMDFSSGLLKLSEKLKLTAEQSERVKAVFKGLFSAVDLLLSAVKTAASTAVSLLSNMGGIGDRFLKIAAAVGGWISSLHDAAEENKIFSKTIDYISSAITKAKEGIDTFREAVSKKLSLENYNSMFSVLSGLWNALKKGAAMAASFGKTVLSGIGKAFSSGGIGGMVDVLNSGIITAILIKIHQFFGGVTDMFEAVADVRGIFDEIKNILSGVCGSLETWQKNIQAGTLLKIAAAVAILTVSLIALSAIDEDKLSGSLAAVTVLLAEVMTALAVFGKMSLKFRGVSKTATILIALAFSVSILAGAMKKISSLSWEEIAKGIVGVGALAGVIAGAAALLSKVSGKAMKGAVNIVIFSAAIKVLSSACIDLAALSWEELAKGLVGIGVLLAEVDIFLNTAKFSGKMLSVSIGMVVLGAAMKILASACCDFGRMSWEDIAKGLASIGALLLEISAFTKLAGNAEHIVSTGIALIAIGAAMKIFVSSVTDLGGLSWEQLGKGLAGMAGALISVAVATKLMPENIIVIGAGLLIVSAAINALTKAFIKSSSMSWSDIARGMAAIGGSFGILAIGLRAMKGTGGATVSLIAVSAGISMLVPVLKILGGMSVKEIATSIAALAATLVTISIAAKLMKPVIGTIMALSGAMSLFGVSCALVGAGIMMATTGLTALAAGLVISSASIGEALSALFDGFARAGDSFSAMLVSLINAACNALDGTVPVIAETLLKTLTQVLSSFKTYVPQTVDLVADILVQIMDGLADKIPAIVHSAANMISAFVDSLDDAIGGAAGWTDILTGMASLSIVISSMANAAQAMSEVGIKGFAKSLAAMAAAVGGIVLLVAALGGLSKISGFTELLNNSSEVFSAIGNALGSLLSGIVNGLITGLPADVSGLLLSFGSVALIMQAIEPIANVVSGINPVAAAKGMAGVAVIILSISAILAALGGLAQIPGCDWLLGEGSEMLSSLATTIGTVLGNLVGSLINSLGSSVNVDITAVMNSVASVTAITLAVAGLSKILKKVSVAAIGKTVLISAVAVAGVAAIIAALGALTLIPGFDTVIEDGVRVLGALGTALGGFIGKFIGGIGAGVTSALPAMGQDLSDFMTAVQPFVDGAAAIDPSILNSIGALAGAVLCITAADLISGIASFISGGNSFEKFGEDISKFGPALFDFAQSVEGLDTEAVSNAANAAASLAKMAKDIPNDGGLAGWFAGENNVADFGDDIASFGPNLKAFSDSVIGVDTEAVSNAANAAASLAKMAKDIPNDGGLAGWFAGENNVAKFGTDIASFGPNLKAFSDSVIGVDTEAVSNAANAAASLAKMAKDIPNDGGLAGWFAGENNVADFGDDIASFGKNLNDFSKNVGDISPKNVSAATDAAATLVGVAERVPNSGGVASWFAGDNNIADFGSDLAEFGKSMKAFSDNVVGLSPENVSAATNAAASLVNMTSHTPEGSALKDLGGSLKSFGENLCDFSKKVDGLDISACSEQIKTLVSTVKNLGEKDISTLSSFGTTLSTTAENGITNFCEKFSGANTTVTTNVKAFIKKVTDTLDDKISDIKKCGQNAAKGFADGIADNAYIAIEKAKEMAQGSANAIRSVLDIHSPSRVFGQFGEFAGMGFAQGISSYAGDAEKAGTDIALAAKNGLSNAAEKLLSVVSADMDTQPVISPVIDLSNVTRGSDQINAMLSRQQAYSINADMNGNLGGSSAGKNANQSSINFTQYISSPKALDSITIYRQTKNQFSRMKEALNRT